LLIHNSLKTDEDEDGGGGDEYFMGVKGKKERKNK
jgi:hypothetical protein